MFGGVVAILNVVILDEAFRYQGTATKPAFESITLAAQDNVKNQT